MSLKRGDTKVLLSEFRALHSLYKEFSPKIRKEAFQVFFNEFSDAYGRHRASYKAWELKKSPSYGKPEVPTGVRYDLEWLAVEYSLGPGNAADLDTGKIKRPLEFAK